MDVPSILEQVGVEIIAQLATLPLVWAFGRLYLWRRNKKREGEDSQLGGTE